MVRKMSDHRAPQHLRPRRAENFLSTELESPRRQRLIPGEPLHQLPESSSNLVEYLNSLRAIRRLWLGRLRSAVEFILREHHDPKSGQLRDVRRELVERSRLLVRTPVVLAIWNALKHAPSSRKLGVEIREKYRRRVLTRDRARTRRDVVKGSRVCRRFRNLSHG